MVHILCSQKVPESLVVLWDGGMILKWQLQGETLAQIPWRLVPHYQDEWALQQFRIRQLHSFFKREQTGVFQGRKHTNRENGKHGDRKENK